MTQALLLIDPGSRREAANRMLEEVAELVRARRPGLIVRAAHMELAPPNVATGFSACVEAGATEVVAMPYFLFRGRHAAEDVPRLVEEAAAQHPGVLWRVADPLGLHPLLAEVVLERAALGGDPAP